MSYYIMKKIKLPTDIINIILSFTGPRKCWKLNNFNYLINEFNNWNRYAKFNQLKILRKSNDQISSINRYYFDLVLYDLIY